jgi:replicative DNA helicase
MSQPKNPMQDPVTGADMPYSQEAEEALLGSLMIDSTALLEVDSVLSSANDFFLLSNRIIYSAMQRLKQRGDAVDNITIVEELSSTNDLEKVGGYAKLVRLTETVGTSMHAPVYAELVARAALRRRMIEASDKMRRLAFDESLNIDEVRAKADNTWMAVTSEIQRNRGEWASDVMSRVYDEIERAMIERKAFSGLPTGLRDVDLLINGLGAGQLIIVAGRPGMGKSAAMDNIALNLVRAGKTVLYATSERSPDQVIRRMAAIESGVNGLKIQSGRMSAQEAAAFTQASARISQYPLKFMDDAEPRPRDISAEANWLVKRHNCEVVLFDGMYRAKTGDSQLDREDRTKYGTIALELKTMARNLNIPVLVTHQLNRGVESRNDKRPLMSDLRESGRIEEEADKIIFLYRDEFYNPATEFPGQCEWIVAKHRDGATGTVATYYEKTTTKFSNASVHRVDLNDI